MKSSEIGSTEPSHTLTHLGHLLNPGDLILGFDLANANLNEPNYEKYERSHQGKIPDVIIVKKYYGDRTVRHRRRQWKLKQLTTEQGSVDGDNRGDYLALMDDLEEEPMLRQNVNIYKDEMKISSQMAVDEDDEENIDHSCPQITLQEMLDDLVIRE